MTSTLRNPLRALAALVTVLCLTAGATLPWVWHTVERVDVVDPSGLSAALYFGPDVRLPAEQRESLLRAAVAKRVVECTGVQHLGMGQVSWFLIAALGVSFAGVAARPRPVLALAVAGLSLAGLAVLFDATLLVHLLDRASAPRLPERVFHGCRWTILAGSLAIALLAVRGRRAVGRGPRAEPDHAPP